MNVRGWIILLSVWLGVVGATAAETATNHSGTVNDEWTRYTNERFGFHVAVPRDLFIARGESANGDGQEFVSVDRAAVVRALGVLRSDPQGGDCSGETSGELDASTGQLLHSKAIFADGRCLILEIRYPESKDPEYGEVAKRIVASFHNRLVEYEWTELLVNRYRLSASWFLEDQNAKGVFGPAFVWLFDEQQRTYSRMSFGSMLAPNSNLMKIGWSDEGWAHFLEYDPSVSSLETVPEVNIDGVLGDHEPIPAVTLIDINFDGHLELMIKADGEQPHHLRYFTFQLAGDNEFNPRLNSDSKINPGNRTIEINNSEGECDSMTEVYGYKELETDIVYSKIQLIKKSGTVSAEVKCWQEEWILRKGVLELVEREEIRALDRK